MNGVVSGLFMQGVFPNRILHRCGLYSFNRETLLEYIERSGFPIVRHSEISFRRKIFGLEEEEKKKQGTESLIMENRDSLRVSQIGAHHFRIASRRNSLGIRDGAERRKRRKNASILEFWKKRCGKILI